MKIRNLSALAVAAGTLVALSSVASATQYNWSFAPDSSTPGYSAAGGSIQSINSSFDSATKRLTWDVQFGPATSGGSLSTKGFWLVLDNGPNPKGHPGELAILYFDASTFAAPKLTVYGYNGQNAANSWQDGNPVASGNQPGDLIKGSKDVGFLNAPLIAQDKTVGGQQVRRFAFDIDASDIIAHSPLYPTAGVDWTGTGFDSKIGVWFHPTTAFNATYANDNKGGIASLQLGTSGYLDGENFNTNIIPAPGSMALVGLGGVLAVRRRRK